MLGWSVPYSFAKATIASALASDPPVIVLDEPTLGQDYASRLRLRGLVRELAEEGKLVLVVTHDPRIVPFADRIIRIEDGRIVGEEAGRAGLNWQDKEAR